ncbi:acyl-[acyl-carrier-protein] thioesterase [Clostridium neuense]|uniref:Acyl-[acyl-carrier-protein] thioesterase n=1 Tax=Clostridium neuense TaxID=1728934 RepID=A0ABW8TJN5_9CLOT
MSKIMKKDYNVHLYEVNYNNKANIVSIMNYMGDLATYQSEKLGVGIEYLMSNKIAWVVYKWDVHMDKYPEYDDTVTISTNPYSIRKFYAYRKFEIFNKGEKIGEANSLWFLINTEKRRPCRVPEDLYNAYGLTKDDDKQLEFEKLLLPSEINSEKRFDVRYSDIDTNRHVNNVKYISWALENIPSDIMKTCSVSDIKVIYEKETSYGETITVQTQMQETEDKYIFDHVIKNSEGEKLTLIKTEFLKG